MDYIQILGFLAALFTTIANLPQAYKIIKTRSTEDISTLSYSFLLTGLILWVIYGFIRNDIPIIIANCISALICAVVLFLKLTPQKNLDALHEKTKSKTD